jgi:hypothetical protein
MNDRRRLMVSKLAEQDRFWKEYEAWYASQEPEALIDLINAIDVEPEDGPSSMRTLDDYGTELCRRLSLHVLRELALRSEQGLIGT